MKNRLLILAVMSFAVMMTAAAAGAEPVFQYSPKSILVEDDVYTGEIHTEYISFKNVGDKDLHVRLVKEQGVDWLGIAQTEVTVAPQQKVFIAVFFLAQAQPCMDGVYESTIKVESDDPVKPAVSVPVKFQARASQYISPVHNLIYFGSGAAPAEELVRLMNAGCQVPLTITNITTSLRYFWLPVMKFPIVVQPGAVFPFYLQFNPPPGLLGTYIGTMTVTSDDPVRPVIEIPIRAIYTNPDPPRVSSNAGPAVETSTWGAIKSLYE